MDCHIIRNFVKIFVSNENQIIRWIVILLGTKEEEEALVSAWVNISEDPIVGNAQIGGIIFILIFILLIIIIIIL